MPAWKSSPAFFWEEAPFFKLLLPIVAAIICYDRAGRASNPGILLAIFCVSVIAIIILDRSQNAGNILVFLRTLLLNIAFFAVGWAACFATDVRNCNTWFGNQLKTASVFTVRVKGDPVGKAHTWRIPVEAEKSLHNSVLRSSDGKAFLFLYKEDAPPSVRQGDLLLIPNKWQRISNRGNPYEFDYAAYAGHTGAWYQEFISPGAIRIMDTSSRKSSFLANVHSWGMGALGKYVNDSATLGLMQAMLLGDELNFDEDTRVVYQDTGIVHIVSISGSHIAFFFVSVSFLFSVFRAKRYNWVKYIATLLLIWCYVLIAGAPVPAVRSGIMFSFLAIGMLIQREKNMLNTLFGTAVLMLLFQPMWLFSLGFQLSFTAVLSLSLFYNHIASLWHPDNRLIKQVWQLTAASLAAEILIAPLVVYYFHVFPVGFIIANMFAYIFMSIIMICGMLIMLLGIVSLSALAASVGALCTAITGRFTALLHIIQSWNPVSFSFLHLTAIEVALLYIIIASTAVFIIYKKISWLIGGLSAVCLLLASGILEEWNTLRQDRLIVYNVSVGHYAERISGRYYTPIGDSFALNEQSQKFVTKSTHIALGAWRKKADTPALSAFVIGGQAVAVLDRPLVLDTSHYMKVDYLVLNYPVERYEGSALRKIFDYKKLIITGAQKHYIAQSWKDSCMQRHIPVHFTQSDGAFVLHTH